MTRESVNHSFGPYRAKFVPRPANLATVQDLADESAAVPAAERHHFGEEAPLLTVEAHEWSTLYGPPAKRYLWVIEPAEVVYAHEQGPFGQTRKKNGCITHTNLTAGRDAHAGGEVWFSSPTRIVINGGSGRYRPRCGEELEVITLAFRQAGFECVSMGWNQETNKEFRTLRQAPSWNS